MTKHKVKPITHGMYEVLEFIAAYEVSDGYSPSIREIVDGTSVTSTSVANYYIDRLQELGYLERERMVARGIRMNPAGYERAGYHPKHIDFVCPHCKQFTTVKLEGKYEKELPAKIATPPTITKRAKVEPLQPVAA